MPGSRPVPTARFQSTLSSRSRSWVSSFPGVRTVKAEVARRAPGELRQPPHTHTHIRAVPLFLPPPKTFCIPRPPPLPWPGILAGELSGPNRG